MGGKDHRVLLRFSITTKYLVCIIEIHSLQNIEKWLYEVISREHKVCKN